MSIRHIRIVSLSRGLLGESFVSHEVALGIERLQSRGIEVSFGRFAREGIDYLGSHPEARAADLLAAFRDPAVDMILCAIGGEDTYRLMPYLFGWSELQHAVTDKVFLGFSDSTVNHFMLHKVGLPTFYGQAFLSDVCEMSEDMLPYSRRYFDELIETGRIAALTPAPVWYESRCDFSPEALGTPLSSHPAEGWKLLQGPPTFSGPVLGGCIDTIFDFFDPGRFGDMPDTIARYGLFPTASDWRGRILLLETSEEKMPPEKYRLALRYLRRAGLFDAVAGVLVGRPADDCWRDEYYAALTEEISRPDLPVVADLSVGHGLPRAIVPFGVCAHVDARRQIITFDNR